MARSVAKTFRQAAQFQHYDLFDGIGSDIVPSGTASPVVHGVVGAHEIMNVLVDRVRVISQLFVAVSAVQQVAEHISFPILRFRIAAAIFTKQLLHLLKRFTVNDRFVNIFEHRPSFGIVFISALVLK